MIDFSHYSDTDGAHLALVAELSSRLADQEAVPVHSDHDAGYAVLRDGRTLDWGTRRPRPVRRRGHTRLATPIAFSDYVTRLLTPDTVIYGDRSEGAFVAVFNDHPASGSDLTGASSALAGWLDHRATLTLKHSTDWLEWIQRDGRLYSQTEFGEFIEAMGHTIVEPDPATMLEVATTLTAKSTLDYSSRTRLDNGDVAFKFEQDTTMRAGRGPTQIEIPSEFTFEARVWEGTDPVQVTARLRVRAERDAVRLGLRLLRVTDAVDHAFGSVRTEIVDRTAGAAQMFLGTPG